MLKLSLMCATNDGGFLQLMSHGKITVFTASMQAEQFRNIVPDAVMQLDGSPFCVHDIEKIAFKVDNSEKWRIVSAKAMELH